MQAALRTGGGGAATGKKGGGSLRPPDLGSVKASSVYLVALGALAALPNSEYISLPTKPNLVTPEPLMMFSTLADKS